MHPEVKSFGSGDVSYNTFGIYWVGVYTKFVIL